MPSFKSIKLSLVMLFSISLAACGGGGGGSDPTKPSVDNFTKSISKNATTVGTLTADNGGKAITAFALSGADAASFDVTTAGVISVKSAVTLDPVTKSSYAFKATATNEIGTSAQANVTITIVTSKPTLTALSASVEEGKTDIGQLVFDNGGKAITAFALSGADAASFNVSDTGAITVKSGITLDSITKSSYAFTATATNEIDTSDPVNVTITVTLVAPNFAGKTAKVMFIGDSITRGQGGSFTPAVAQENINAAEAALESASTAKSNADTAAANANTAVTKLGTTGIPTANELSDAATAATTAKTKSVGTSAVTATSEAKASIDTAVTTPTATNIATARDKAALAKTATASVKTVADTAQTNAQTAVDTAVTAAQSDGVFRPSYRKNLKELSATSVIDFVAIGMNKSGNIPAANGKPEFTDTAHEGYSGWKASQFTDKYAAYVCNSENSGSNKDCEISQIGQILTGGAVISATNGVVTLVGTDAPGTILPAEVCKAAQVSSGACTVLGSILGTPAILQDKLDVIDYTLSANGAANTPDIVLIHLGTNDMAFQAGGETKAAERAAKGVKEIITRLRVNNPRVVILLAKIIPITAPFDTTTTGELDKGIIAFNNELEDIKSADTNTTSPLVIVDQHSALAATDLIDGVHPNAAGDGKMAQVWFDALKLYFE